MYLSAWLSVLPLLTNGVAAIRNSSTLNRGPCPLLNSLANHNFLPHSGKGISVPKLIAALDDALNIDDTGKAFFKVQGEKALTISSTGDNTTFNLFDLSAHNVIEHDGSLSRADIATGNGNNWSFNQTIFDETKGYWTAETITVAAGARTLYQRQQSAKQVNPEYNLPSNQLLNALGQTAMYLGVFGNYNTGDARRDWVESFFENERLPYELGWRRKSDNDTITQAGIVGLITKVATSYQQLTMVDQ